MKYTLEVSSQGPCDCCPPDVDESTWRTPEEAMAAAERREGGTLTWTEQRSYADGLRFWQAKSSRWWESFEILEEEGAEE